MIARIDPMPTMKHSGRHVVKKLTSLVGRHNIGGNLPILYCDADINMTGARILRNTAPVTSTTCKISFVFLSLYFLDHIGKMILIHKWIKCSSHRMAISASNQW